MPNVNFTREEAEALSESLADQDGEFKSTQLRMAMNANGDENYDVEKVNYLLTQLGRGYVSLESGHVTGNYTWSIRSEPPYSPDKLYDRVVQSNYSDKNKHWEKTLDW